MNSAVKIELLQKERQVVRCKRCQRYGHVQRYCDYNYRFVECANSHPTAQCTKSVKVPAKHIHCEKEHPANCRRIGFLNLKLRTQPT